MIQLMTKVNIIDNSGGNIGRCIKILHPHGRKYAKIGDIILVSIQEIVSGNNSNANNSKNKTSNLATAKDMTKGAMYKALVVRTKMSNGLTNFNKKTAQFDDNAVVLIKSGQQAKGQTRIKMGALTELSPIGTRIKGPISALLYKDATKYQKILSLSKYHY